MKKLILKILIAAFLLQTIYIEKIFSSQAILPESSFESNSEISPEVSSEVSKGSDAEPVIEAYFISSPVYIPKEEAPKEEALEENRFEKSDEENFSNPANKENSNVQVSNNTESQDEQEVDLIPIPKRLIDSSDVLKKMIAKSTKFSDSDYVFLNASPVTVQALTDFCCSNKDPVKIIEKLHESSLFDEFTDLLEYLNLELAYDFPDRMIQFLYESTNGNKAELEKLIIGDEFNFDNITKVILAKEYFYQHYDPSKPKYLYQLKLDIPYGFSIKELLEHKCLTNIYKQENSDLIIDLSGFMIKSLEGLLDIPDIMQAGKLNLSANKLFKIMPDSFIKFANLYALNLSRNKINKIEPNAFRGLTNLNQLDLSGNFIDSLDFNVFAGLNDLTILDLSRNSLEELKPNQFKGLEKLSNLSLRENKINKIDDDAFEGLINLILLDLSDNQISSMKKDLFKNLKKLGIVILHNNPITISRHHFDSDIDVIS